MILGYSLLNDLTYCFFVIVGESQENIQFSMAAIKQACEDIYDFKGCPRYGLSDGANAFGNAAEFLYEDIQWNTCYMHIKVRVQFYLCLYLFLTNCFFRFVALKMEVDFSQRSRIRITSCFLRKELRLCTALLMMFFLKLLLRCLKKRPWRNSEKMSLLNTSRTSMVLTLVSLNCLTVLVFTVYLHAYFQFAGRHSRWGLCHVEAGCPTSNNGLEATNRALKDDGTFRDRPPAVHLLSSALFSWMRHTSREQESFAIEPKVCEHGTTTD